MQTIPLRKGRQTVLDLINRDNNKSFRMDQVRLSDPIAIVGQVRNTAVRVYQDDRSPSAPGVTVWYNRLDIDQVFKAMWGQTTTLQLDIRNYSRLSEMLDVINTGFSFELVEDDIIDIELNHDVEVGEAVLAMSPRSHLYTGSITIQLFNIDLSHVRITADGRIRTTVDDIRYVS